MAASPDFGDPTVVPELIAQHLYNGVSGITVTAEQLTDAVGEITVQTQTLGSALLEVNLIDPDWKFHRSGLCDVDSDGFLPQVDVNFPEGTDVWWRLAMVDGGTDFSAANLTLTFQMRIISYLMDCWGPIGWPGGKAGSTRAQFQKMLVDRMPHELPKQSRGPGSSPIRFVCPEINELQPVASSNAAGQEIITSQQASAQAAGINKMPALTAASKVTVKGQKPSTVQLQTINTLLGVGQSNGAPTEALIAVIYAGMGETSLGADPSTYAPNGASTAQSAQGYWGVLQGAASLWPDPHDTTAMATAFFKGGKGFDAGGAIALAKSGVNNPAEIAIKVEVPSIWPADAYAKEWPGGQQAGIQEATAIVNAFGGGGVGAGAPQSDIAQLTRGTPDNPDEDSWMCMQRLASEVNWKVFASPSPAPGVWGNYLYYMDGPTLVAQKPSLYLELSDDGTTWSAKDPDTGKTVAGDGVVTALHHTVDNCLAIDTPIPTPTGWTTMAKLEPGDMVVGANGRPTRVLRVSDVHHRDCYRVRFSDGTSIVTDAGHLWETVACRHDGATVETIAPGRYRGIRTTAQIRDTLRTPADRWRPNGTLNHRVRLADPLDLPERELPVEPYVLGYWLGDGHAASPLISGSSLDIPSLVAEIKRAGYGCAVREYAASPTGYSNTVQTRVALYLNRRRGSRYHDNMTRRLRELGVLDNKHVPPSYLRASARQRLALLQGLMDSDGSISRYCCLCLADERLARDALELIRSLGFRANWTEKPPRGLSRRQYVINFATRPHINVFRLPRKAEQYARRRAAKTTRGPRDRTVTSVEPVAAAPVKCIEVAAADHLFLAGEAMVPTHNTATTVQQTRKVKGKAQRNTRIRTPQTPTQIKLNILCGAMEFNGGDVFVFHNAGPLKGRWIVEDATVNTLQDLFSQFTLGPPTYPYPEPQATQGQGNNAGPADVSAYTNPFAYVSNLTPERIDMGVDYSGTGPVGALGDGTVFCTAGPGWPGGNFIGIKLTAGPFNGKFYFTAEDITPSVKVGDNVKAGQQIGVMFNGGSGIEIGWASGNSDEALAAHLGQQASGDPGGWSTACGRNMNDLLKALGVPSGTLQPNPPNQSMPAGWPSIDGSAAGQTPQSQSPLAENPRGGSSKGGLLADTPRAADPAHTIGGIFGSLFSG